MPDLLLCDVTLKAEGQCYFYPPPSLMRFPLNSPPPTSISDIYMLGRQIAFVMQHECLR